MSEPRRSTRARAREDAVPAPAPEPAETPSKTPAKSLKRKRPAPAVKDATTAGGAVETSHKPPEHFLPIRLVEGQPLPTLPQPQPLDLNANEWQDVRQSGVLSASLQQSRAVWISGSNFRLFHAFFTPPKKVADRTDEDKQAMQRQKDIIRNFPQLGGTVEARLVIEPHTFPIRLYGPREYVRQAQKKAPPQYGQWPNHNQYPPYHQQPQPYTNPSTPYAKPTPPQPRPSQPKPQHQPPGPAPGAPNTPAPDPVIQALAARAGTDPELKAVMKIVATGKASAKQLSFFQGHIAQLTAMLEKQKAEAARAAPPPTLPQASQPPAAAYPLPQQTPQPSHAPPTPQTPQVAGQAPQAQHPPPPSTYQPPMTPTPQQHVPPMMPAPQQHAPPPQVRPPHPNQYTYNQPHQQMTPYNQAAQPPRTSYRPLIFDFVEGNGDKFYFPSYSMMEWLENNQGVKFSFLITKMKQKVKEEQKSKEKVPSTPAPKGNTTANFTAGQTPAANSGVAGTPAGTANANANPTATPNPNTPAKTNTTVTATPNTTAPFQPNPNTHTPANPNQPNPIAPAPTPTTPQYVPPPRIEDSDEKTDIKDIDVYCPITVVVESSNFEILQSLPRAIRPADQVAKYMDEVMDTCTRVQPTHLAFRLPKEVVVGAEGQGGGGDVAAAPMVVDLLDEAGPGAKRKKSRVSIAA